MTYVPVGRYDGQGLSPVTGRDRQKAERCLQPMDRREVGFTDSGGFPFRRRLADKDDLEDWQESWPFTAVDVLFAASLSMAWSSRTGLCSCLLGRATRHGFSGHERGPAGHGGAPNLDGKVSDFIFEADRTRKAMLVRPALSCNRRAETCSGASLGEVGGRLTSAVPLGLRLEPDAAHAGKRRHGSYTLAAAKEPGKSSRKRRSSMSRPPWPPSSELGVIAGTGGRPSPSSKEDGARVASRLVRLFLARRLRPVRNLKESTQLSQFAHWSAPQNPIIDGGHHGKDTGQQRSDFSRP